MTFEMMNADHRLLQRESECARDARADEQGPREPGTLRVGDRVDLANLDACLVEHLTQER